MNKVVAVIAAHPDDEILGCGGTIAKHVLQGDQVHILIMAEGATSRSQVRDRMSRQAELSELSQAADNARKIVGAHSVKLLDFPDNRMDGIDLLDVVKEIESFFVQYGPGIVYTHHGSDVNVDHRVVHQAVVTAARPIPGQIVKAVLAFEVMSSSEWQPATSLKPFQPNWFVPLDEECLKKKLLALEAYAAEMRSWPHSRSYRTLEYLARLRGSTVGYEAAEAFELCRYID